MKLGVKELIVLCIYCWGHPLLYTCSGSVAVWTLLSGSLQQQQGRVRGQQDRSVAFQQAQKSTTIRDRSRRQHGRTIVRCKARSDKVARLLAGLQIVVRDAL